MFIGCPLRFGAPGIILCFQNLESCDVLQVSINLNQINTLAAIMAMVSSNASLFSPDLNVSIAKNCVNACDCLAL